MYKILILLWVFIALSLSLKAQDPQFTQFNAQPILYNPAYAGATRNCRIINQYRQQWLNIPSTIDHSGQFDTYATSVDFFNLRRHFGFGLIFTNDNAGSLGIQSNLIGLAISNEQRLGKNLVARLGLQGTYMQRNLMNAALVFEDQLDINGGVGTSREGLGMSNQVSDWDISAGLLLSSTYWFVGFSNQNTRRPNLSLFDQDGESSRIPTRYNVELGASLPIFRRDQRSDEMDLGVFKMQLLYRKQGGNEQVDIGAFLNLNVNKSNVFKSGLYYRGLKNADALAPYVGWQSTDLPWIDLDLGVSYDWTISSLGNTGGTYELVLRMSCKGRKDKAYDRLITSGCNPNLAKDIMENYWWDGYRSSENTEQKQKYKKNITKKRKDFMIMQTY
ncbi:MAG: PorP/SprF family type IX secretion system membrane protein [Microscillaceae bacterium]|nr:PorP/SprF family type IX secretion system membrane protein [Microscillaceae bacterium]